MRVKKKENETEKNSERERETKREAYIYGQKTLSHDKILAKYY